MCRRNGAHQLALELNWSAEQLASGLQVPYFSPTKRDDLNILEVLRQHKVWRKKKKKKKKKI